jgi:hypothetical protein
LFLLIRLFFSSRAAVIAENLFLRKQLALFQERRVKPRRSTAATRALMVLLSRFLDWREALVIVKPETLASHRVPDVLEMEVSKARPTATAKEPARIDSGDGARQPDLGRGTDR